MEESVRLEDVTVSYGTDEPVIEKVSFVLQPGSKVGIIGPNGAGKSTLMKAIVGLLTLDQGRVEVLGGSIDQNRKSVAYVPQKEDIDWDFPVSVYDVVMMGRYVHLGWIKRPREQDHQIVTEALKEVGMLEYQNRQVGKLSGGQRQRVFLARALAQRAEVMLLDEPFAGVDQTTEEVIYNLLDQISQEGKTVIVVHHDLKKVEEYFDNLILVNKEIIAYGPTQSTFTPNYLKKTFSQQSTTAQNDLVVMT
ncbi:metal ABC transporter ATP-binding protein [Natroniella sulfidigena]|uniref:metal ABC transporter ATP-binding protein n=1 Tax=Natroniella sulfidigena TaxID=723921 RepID=UPI00200A4FE4|nr:metal ABC transporter ATP-binding protein [Natroniella sulfidigena]MCK8815994.1 metal ABC transporter ATP-binding protein [Natroniella sulfidigena]